MISSRMSAKIAGIGLLLMAALAIFANFFVLERLIVQGDPTTTIGNIVAHELLYRFGVASFVLVFILDVIVAWALYVFFRPVNKDLSVLAAWSRLAYAAVLGVAVAHLFDALQLVMGGASAGRESLELRAQVASSISSFDSVWVIGLLLFGVHLLVLGYLAFRSSHVPGIIGALLIAAGVGYAIDGFAKLLLPMYADHEAIFLAIVAIPAVLGELSLAIWLVVRGSKVPQEG